MEKPTVYLPIRDLKNPFFRHAGDTFRETVQLWDDRGLVDVVLTTGGYVWIADEETDKGVVLYDRPTLEWWQRAPPKAYKFALFGNQIPGDAVPRSFPWIFWGRRPSLLAQYEGKPVPTHDERPIQSIFLGKIENQVQQRFRNPAEWKNVIEEFHLVVGLQSQYPYTQSEYLEHIRKAKYGLCLRGYGPKCNREIELMAMGTVPIVTEDVDMLGYFDPPRENVHYLKVKSPVEVPELLASVTEQEWTNMSRQCVDWYLRNCSVVGSFYTTIRLINTISTSHSIQKPISMAKSLGPKLDGVKRVVVDTVFFERPFSGISRVWVGLLEALMEHIPATMMFGRDRFEIVLLLRGKAQLPPGILQRFSFVGTPTFNYHTADLDVKVLNEMCNKLDADLFISSYYTYSTAVDCLAFIHDMIPERFRMHSDAMWEQKDKCLANAKAYLCVSDATKRDLLKFCPRATEQNTVVVKNSFSPSVFRGVDEDLHHPELAKRAIKAELGVDTPFVLVIASNTNAYKNMRLVVDAMRMHADYFKQPNGLGVVLLTNHAGFRPKLPEDTKFKVVSNIKDRQLGLLYGLASALVYPSKCEGFGLPVLEAFWSECPVICSKQSGSIPEIGGDGCFYVDPDDPEDLFKVLVDVTSGAIESVVRDKAAVGIKRLELFTPERQLCDFVQCIRRALAGDMTASVEELKVSSTPCQPPKRSKTTNMSQPTTAPESVSAAPAQPPAPAASNNEPEKPKKKEAIFNGIHVLVQYFACSDEDRRAEYDFCVQANLANEHVAKIHCLLEPDTTVPEWLSTHPKYVEARVSTRLTYKQAFDYANENLVGEICAVMNLDIFLDHSSEWSGTAYTIIPETGEVVDGLLDMGVVLCLSRHEFDGVSASTKDEKLQNLAYCQAQDCWVFRAPLFVQDCDFKMGMLGCDNAIAHRLKISDYIPVNSPNEFKIHHYDVCRRKDGSNFLAHHPPNPERPEDRGMYLVPDYNAIRSVDDLINKMGLGHIHRYMTICDVMTRYIKLSNPHAAEKKNN